MNPELQSLRNQIDALDTEVLRLLERRFELTKKVGETKEQTGLPTEDLEREHQIIDDKISKSNLNPEFIENLYQMVINESKRRQRNES